MRDGGGQTEPWKPAKDILLSLSERRRGQGEESEMPRQSATARTGGLEALHMPQLLMGTGRASGAGRGQRREAGKALPRAKVGGAF